MRKCPVAVLDACVLVPMPLADTLLRLAKSPELFEARWSREILVEVSRTLINRFAKSPEKARSRETAMSKAFPDSLVENYGRLISVMENHPKDRHVLAAAVECQADYLVTLNLKDFPAKSAEKYRVEVIDPSAFLNHLWDLNNSLIEERLDEQAAAISVSRELLLNRLAKLVPGFVKTIRGDYYGTS